MMVRPFVSGNNVVKKQSPVDNGHRLFMAAWSLSCGQSVQTKLGEMCCCDRTNTALPITHVSL
jgi:hypothetical protein